ncbi:MAG: hypothetical protein MN733_25775 [Nitrososphaera sp.]|nr:hypothetical protein [Nitrososphaera sp.]
MIDFKWPKQAEAIPQADMDAENAPVQQGAFNFIGHAGLAHYERAWQSQLQIVREQHPGLVVIPYPDTPVTFFNAVANTVRKVIVPSVAKLFTIGGFSTNIYLSKNLFTLPVPASTGDVESENPGPINLGTVQFGAVWFPCEGLSALYIGTAAANVAVTVGYWNGFGPKLLQPQRCDDECVVDKALSK